MLSDTRVRLQEGSPRQPASSKAGPGGVLVAQEQDNSHVGLFFVSLKSLVKKTFFSLTLAPPPPPSWSTSVQHVGIGARLL